MSYTAFTFIIFMLVTMLLYFIMPRRARWGVLLAASYLFYFLSSKLLVFSVSIRPGARADQYAIPFGQKDSAKGREKGTAAENGKQEKIGCIFGGAL